MDDLFDHLGIGDGPGLPDAENDDTRIKSVEGAAPSSTDIVLADDIADSAPRLGGPGRPKGSTKAALGHEELREWHKMLADFMLMNPGAKNAELGAQFGVTKEWISRVRNSDAFVAYFNDRLSSHQSVVSNQIVSRAGEVALKGLEKMGQKMNSNADNISLGEITKATEMAGKMLGLGHAKSGPTLNVDNSVKVEVPGVNKQLLAQARQVMEDVGHHNSALYNESVEDAEVIDGVLGDLPDDIVGTPEYIDTGKLVRGETDYEQEEAAEEQEFIDKAIRNTRGSEVDSAE